MTFYILHKDFSQSRKRTNNKRGEVSNVYVPNKNPFVVSDNGSNYLV